MSAFIFKSLEIDASLNKLAASTATHPHVVRAFYDEEVARLMGGDEELRTLAEGEAFSNCLAKFTELAAHQARLSRNPRGKK